MSATFFSRPLPSFNFRLLLKLALIFWFSTAACQNLESASAASDNIKQQFITALENLELEYSQKLIEESAAKLTEKWKAEGWLQLCHAYYRMGLDEKAKLLLEKHWAWIESSSYLPYGFLLKAKLEPTDLLAWEDYLQAEKKVSIDSWPREDVQHYIALSTRLQEAFESKLELTMRLAKGPFPETSLPQFLELQNLVKEDKVPDHRAHSFEGINLMRELILQSAIVKLELGQTKQVAQSFEFWPERKKVEMTGQELSSELLKQELERYIILGKAALADKEAEQAYDFFHEGLTFDAEKKRFPLLRFRATLGCVHALALQGRVSEALELLESSKTLVSSCREKDLDIASTLFLEEKCALLSGVGRIHEALDLLNETLKKSRADLRPTSLLLIKARLYQKLGELELADETYLELLQNQDDLGVATAICYLLDRCEKSSGSNSINSLRLSLLQFIVKGIPAYLDDLIKLRLITWAIDEKIEALDKLKPTLLTTLSSIEAQEYKIESSYLILLLCEEELSKKELEARYAALFQKCIEEKMEKELAFLIEAKAVFFQSTDTALQIDQLQEILQREGLQPFLQTKERILLLLLQKALQSNDKNAGLSAKRVYEIERSKFSSGPLNPSVQWAYLDLCLSLENNKANSSSLIVQLSKLEALNSFWGVQATKTHVRELIRDHKYDRAKELWLTFCHRTDLDPQAKKLAFIEYADLLFRLDEGCLAREQIQQILETWPDIKIRPWLELRRFTLREYQECASGSTELLNSLIAKYRQHEVALSAYYLRALQSSKKVSGSQQLRLWEDVFRKAQDLAKQAPLTLDMQLCQACAILETVKCLQELQMEQQAIGALRNLLSLSSSFSTLSALGYEIEQEARYWLYVLLQSQGNKKEAAMQLKLLLQEPYSTLWQSKARLEVAHKKLEKSDFKKALEQLRLIDASSMAIKAKRVLLAAYCYKGLGQATQAENLLFELVQMGTNDSQEEKEQVELLQAEGLWQLYNWLKSSQIERARKCLQNLKDYPQSPYSSEAKKILDLSDISMRSP